MVPCDDDDRTKSKRRRATYFHATKAGRDHPTKPRVAELFKDQDEMDDHMNCLKKRKRAQDKVDQQISISAQKPASIDFDFSCWASGDAKKLFVPVAGELVPECLERCVDLLRHSNSCEAACVDVVDTHDKDGLCNRAATFKTRQQSMLSCQACIFTLAWMNQQRDYDVPNKTWLVHRF
jgi:hypothetical protein